MYSKNFLFVVSTMAFTRKETKNDLANSFPLYYSPPTIFTEVPATSTETQKFGAADLRSKSLAWATKNFSLSSGETINVSGAHLDEQSTLYHCSMVKVSQGLEIVNSVATLTMNNNGQVVAQGNSWVKTDTPPTLMKRGEGISCEQGLTNVLSSLKLTDNAKNWSQSVVGGQTVIKGVGSTISDVLCSEKLYQTSAALRHVLDLTVPTVDAYFNLMVDKETGKVIGAVDYNSNFVITESGRLGKRQAQTFKYRAMRLGDLNPKVKLPTIVTNPADLKASPNGWHGAESETSGNNVFAAENSGNLGSVQQITAAGKQVSVNGFNFDAGIIDDTRQDPTQYVKASVVNAFFLSNEYHDIMFQYGFTEAAGNFQNVNTKGGKGNDAVIALVQDGSGTNNANFASPPDGQAGIMRMFIFDQSNPRRDGAFENGIIIHELTHGLSNRLTGGPANANCLATAEAGGMGEGWSDAISTALDATAANTRADDVVVGEYALNNLISGVRNFAYSTNLERNPTTFSFGQRSQQVHNVGEIWASMLFEVFWNMVDKNGFDANFKTNPTGKQGNNQFLQVVLGGMKIQPCNPSFIQARDAILAADKQLFGGANSCEISTGFAKRGLGVGAKIKFVDNFDVPAGCEAGTAANQTGANQTGATNAQRGNQ
jgi:extracellular elastinolytic metalloproteinase